MDSAAQSLTALVATVDIAAGATQLMTHMMCRRSRSFDPDELVQLYGIEELLRLETELKTSEGGTSPACRDAKANILKYLQVRTVTNFEQHYDDLYLGLNKRELEYLQSIVPARSKELLQPKLLERQNRGEDDQLEKQLQFYLADADPAKQRLDELVTKIAQDSSKFEVQCVDIKSPESTRRKARRFYGKDVRKVADMARVAVICATPEALKEVYLAIMGLPKRDVRRVTNGFISDWMPSGYRDVKVNLVVNEHLCEIQLHLREFFSLKGGQHAVYEWARDLNVTTEMRPEDLFEHLSDKVAKEMVRLAEQNWCGTRNLLWRLQVAAGQYDLAEENLRQRLRYAEHRAQGWEAYDNEQKRRLALSLAGGMSALAYVLELQGKFDEAEPLYERAQANREEVLGLEHPEVARTLNNRATLLQSQGNYKEAGVLFERSHSIHEKALGPNHPRVAESLNNRAVLSNAQGNYAEAVLLSEQAMEIWKRVLGAENPRFAIALNNQATLLLDNRAGWVERQEAELLLERSQAILEKSLGPDHPHLAGTLHNRATLLQRSGNYDEARTLYERSLAIREKAFGPHHPAVAQSLNHRAGLSTAQFRYAEAGPLYERCQAIMEKVLGPEHPSLATTLNSRAECLKAQGKFDDAEPLYVRAIAIGEKVLGPHPDLAAWLKNRALLLENQEKFAEAEPLHERCEAMLEKVLGPDHPDVAELLKDRAEALRARGNYSTAVRLNERATEILISALGPDNSAVAAALTSRAGYLESQGKFDDADPLYVRTLEILALIRGEDHPVYAGTLKLHAGLLGKQGKFAEAELLFERCQEIEEKAWGHDHTMLNACLATTFNSWAEMLRAQGKYERSETLKKRALAAEEIFDNSCEELLKGAEDY
ncbi:unnamed protein product [Ectocarpus sp. 4 AP-2014]